MLEILWFLLPAGTANMAAGISGKIFPRLDTPLDFGLTFRQKRIFGDHKTIRGLVVGVLVGAVVYIFQSFLYNHFPAIQQIDLHKFSQKPILAILLPLSALCGDALKSFFKRQANIDSGKPWFPFDQLDWILGALLASSLLLDFTFSFSMMVISLGVILHIIVKLIGYLLKLQTEKF